MRLMCQCIFNTGRQSGIRQTIVLRRLSKTLNRVTYDRYQKKKLASHYYVLNIVKFSNNS